MITDKWFSEKILIHIFHLKRKHFLAKISLNSDQLSFGAKINISNNYKIENSVNKRFSVKIGFIRDTCFSKQISLFLTKNIHIFKKKKTYFSAKITFICSLFVNKRFSESISVDF